VNEVRERTAPEAAMPLSPSCGFGVA